MNALFVKVKSRLGIVRGHPLLTRKLCANRKNIYTPKLPPSNLGIRNPQHGYKAGSREGQNSVCKSNRHNKKSFNRNGNRHNVSRTGTA